MAERPKHRQSNLDHENSSQERGEWLSGSWFEWAWGAVIFAAMFAVPIFMPGLQAEESWSVTLWGLVILFSVPLVGLASQYAVMRSFSARPRFDWLRFTWRSALGSVWTAEGHRFSKDEFATVCQRPFLVVLAVTVLYVLVMPADGWWLPPLLLYAATEARRMWFYLVTLRQPPGTLIEEASDGTVVYRPERPAPVR